jgi:hypothetical protein
MLKSTQAELVLITESVRSTIVRDSRVPIRKSFSMFARILEVYSQRFIKDLSRLRQSFIGLS